MITCLLPIRKRRGALQKTAAVTKHGWDASLRQFMRQEVVNCGQKTSVGKQKIERKKNVLSLRPRQDGGRKAVAVLNCRSDASRVARFFTIQNIKTGKNIPKYTKRP
jgi:hypothetical protein